MKGIFSVFIMIMVVSAAFSQNNPSPIIGTNLERGDSLRVLRLAVSCNGEYTTSVGGVAKAKENLNAWLEQINEIYGREFSVRFELVPNNDLLIYTNSKKDPWPNMDGNMGCDGSDNIMNIQASLIDEVIGVANYDFSHVILGPKFKGGGCGGGFKTGYSGMFDIPVTRHEIGHQFSQAHTINHGGNNNYELENGGWSIQGGNKYGYAHSYSFHQLANHLQNFDAKTGTRIPTGNTIPSVSAGADAYIPISTPYLLKAVGVDPDPGDVLTYVWDYLDAGIPQSIPVKDDSQGALFMRLIPTRSATRSIPKTSDINANIDAGTQEQLPTQERDMNIRVTINDSHEILYKGEKVKASGVSSDDIKIRVIDNGGAFKVTSQRTDVSYSSGSSQMVSWKVAGTDKEPINCAVVDIKLSIDGGLTYPYRLASGTSNDGNEKVYIPEGIPQSTSLARIRVECASFDNVRFFDVSSSNFTINSDCKSQGGIIYPANPVSAASGSNLLNLTSNVIYELGTTVEIPFRIDDSKPTSVFGLFEDQRNLSCIKGCCEVPYDEVPFTVDQTGTYTLNFNFDSYAEMASIYGQSYNPSDYCTNFITSGAYATPGGVAYNSNQKVQMEAGEKYYLIVHRLFSSSTVTGSLLISSATGGEAVIFSESFTPSVSDYSYAYAAVNAITGTIASVSEDADFRNLPIGSYDVYGISYHTNDTPLSKLSALSKEKALNLGNCISFSQNYIELKIEGCDLITILPTTTSPIDPETNTFSQGLKIIYELPPNSGHISINGQDFSITGSPQFETLTGLSTDESMFNIKAFFSANPACTFAVNNLFRVPTAINGPSQNVIVSKTEDCDLIAVLPTIASATDPATATYSQSVKIMYEFPPNAGHITINGQNFRITRSPQIETLTKLSADEKQVNITAFFSANPGCKFSDENSFKAPSADNRERNIIGEYHRFPVENDWHIVYIEKDESGGYLWRNKAGVQWKVTYQNNALKWDSSSPYGEMILDASFEIDKKGSNVPLLKGFKESQMEFYQKVK